MKVFISYSHRDEEAVRRLKTHMAVLERDGKIETWHDRRLLAGSTIDREIDAQLEGCELFLAVVSPDFLASDYCYSREMEAALGRHHGGETRIVPIIVEPCDWRSTPLGEIKAVPRDGEPIAKWENPNDAYLDVVNELRRIIDENETKAGAAAVPSSTPNQPSTDVVVRKLKHYLSESRHRILLSDLIDDTVRGIVEKTSGDAFAQSEPQPTRELIVERLKAYDAACSTLTAMASSGGAWAKEEHHSMWCRAMEHLCPTTDPNGYTVWLSLRRYPGTLLLYALGLGAVDRGNLELLNGLLDVQIHRIQEVDVPAIWSLPPTVLLPQGGMELHGEGGLDENRTPLNSWIHDSLKHQTKHEFRDDDHFTQIFDKLEILLALASGGRASGPQWGYRLVGCFFWRGTTRDRFLAEIKSSLDKDGDRSRYVRFGLCGKNPDDCRERIERLEEIIAEMSWDLRFKFDRMRQSQSS
ncbi:MAG: toll/interleukin-1 receptor domain-containing protein [Gammaproteobacteria bacterium]|nr:toll/interleukin-1 receptor domain-containing protein [Gammaproteobacteria bacterium]